MVEIETPLEDSKKYKGSDTLVFEHSARTENTNPKSPQKKQKTITAVPAWLPSSLLLPWISKSACVTAIFSPYTYLSLLGILLFRSRIIYTYHRARPLEHEKHM